MPSMKRLPEYWSVFVVLVFCSAGLVGSLWGAQEAVPHALGEQKVAVLVAHFPGTPVSTSMADLREIFFSQASPSLATYLKEVSYGKTWVTGDVFGPYSLSRSYGWETNEWNAALAETLKLAGSGVNLREYNELVLIYPLPGIGANWAGNAGHGCVIEGYCPAGSPLRVTFLGSGPLSTPRQKVYAVALHEFLHDLGEPHADTLDYAPETLGVPDPRFSYASLESDPEVAAKAIDGGLFRNAADVIGAPMGGNSLCSGVVAAHLPAPFKYHAGWLEKGVNLTEVENDGTFLLKPLETSTAGVQALRVRRVPGSDLWLWIEYRQDLGLDHSLASCAPQIFNGAVIHYEVPPETESAIPLCPLGGRVCGRVALLDMTPDTTPHDFRDAALVSGKTWADPYGPLTIRIGSGGAEGLQVTISYDTPCATFTPSSRAHGRQSETGAIQIAAPAGCDWTASVYRSPNWLTISGGKTGRGDGTLGYAAAANDTYHQRNGWIAIARQVFVVTQDYERVAPVGERAQPNKGRSAADQPSDPEFDFYYIDRNGGQDIRRAYVLFADQPSARGACEVEYDVPTKRYRVADNSGEGWSEWSLPFGQATWPNPQNSQCIVRFAAPAGPGGDEFYMSFHFTFKAPLAGTKNIYLRAVDADGLESTWLPVGAWTIYVNHPPAAVSAMPDSGQGASQKFRVLYRDPDGAIDFSSVQLTVGASTNRPRCYLAFVPDHSKLYLESDTGGWQSPLVAGSRGILQNQSCAVDVSGVSASAEGTDLTLTVPLIFNSKFAGAKSLYGSASDVVGAMSSWSKLGSWTVPQATCSFSFDPSAVEAGANETKGVVAVSTTADCAWVVSSGVPWIDLRGGLSGTGAGTVPFTVRTNPLAVPRSGSITIGGESIPVTQAGRETPLGPPLADSFTNGASFAALRAFPAATWVTISGSNLSPLTRTWNESDFVGNKLPTELDGVSIAINGQPAYISYISPTQLNVLMPDDDGQTAWNLRVTTPAGSEPYTHGLIKSIYSPGFFMFDPEGRKYIAARHQDGSLLAKPGLYAGVATSPAKPSETVMLFGTGFGPTQPPCPAAELVPAPAPATTRITVRIGGQIADVTFAGLVSPGLFQLNVVVPPGMADGDQRVVAEVAGAQTQAGAYLTIRK